MNPLLNLLTSRREASRSEGAQVATSSAELSANDLLHAFDKSLKLRQSLSADFPRNAQAEDTVANLVESAVARLVANPNARLTCSQLLSVETIVRADGTRPSLLISEGSANPDDPMAGDWRDSLVATRSAVERIASATVRVQPRGGSRSNFFGSAFLIGVQPARLVTNRHVALQALSRAVTTREPTTNTMIASYQVHAGTIEVDFVGEHGNAMSDVRHVKRVFLPPWPSTIEHPSLDIAILELADTDPATLPEPIVLRRSISFETAGVLNSFCTIGFPATPAQRIGIVDGIDWEYVDRAIFNEQYGVKRLAPGLVQRTFAELDEHGAGFTFGHDASTLGGSSGSPVCAWLDGGVCFGLHFSGVGNGSNRAHGFSSQRTANLLHELLALPEFSQ